MWLSSVLLFKKKPKTCYFFLGIGLISIVVGLALLPLHWLYILLGVLAVVVGSVVQTEEWKTGKRIKAVIFIIAVAVGSLLTTKGWNEWGNYSQKNALIVGLAREWLLNEWHENTAMSLDVNDPDFGKEHFMYEHFRTSAQASIMTSALFDLRNQKDRELLLTVGSYEDTIGTYNTFLDLENEECLRFPENVKQQKRKDVYLAIRDINALHIHFKRYHKELLNLLKKDYSWALDEARPILASIKKQKVTKE
jgi:hypothetical protein